MQHLTRGGRSGVLVPIQLMMTITRPEGESTYRYLTPLSAASIAMVHGKARMGSVEGARRVARILRDTLDGSLYNIVQVNTDVTIYPPTETKCIWCGKDYIQRGTANPSSFDGHRGPMGGCPGPSDPELYVAWMTGRVG